MWPPRLTRQRKLQSGVPHPAGDAALFLCSPARNPSHDAGDEMPHVFQITRVHLLPDSMHFHMLTHLGPRSFSTKRWSDLAVAIQTIQAENPAVQMHFEGAWIQDSRHLANRRHLHDLVWLMPYHQSDVPSGMVWRSGAYAPVKLLPGIRWQNLGRHDALGADLHATMMLDLVPSLEVGRLEGGEVNWEARPEFLPVEDLVLL